MATRATRDMSIDEFDAWSAATKRVESVQKAADERGGPSLSLVPVEEQEIAWPTDLLAPATAAEDGVEPVAPMPFDVAIAELRRVAGSAKVVA